MNGADILPVARQHLGEDYVYGARAPLSNPNHTGPWDCAEFASWCAYQVYGRVFGCYGNDPATADPYSGKWWDDAVQAGTLVTVAEAIARPGAILLRRPTASLRGHVAISNGTGGTVEARGAAYGVVETTDASSRAWDGGALVPGVAYTGRSAGAKIYPSLPKDVIRVQNPFVRGKKVEKLQADLKALKFDPGPVDGIYGYETAAAVTNFQLKSGLLADGEYGPRTAEAVKTALKK